MAVLFEIDYFTNIGSFRITAGDGNDVLTGGDGGDRALWRGQWR